MNKYNDEDDDNDLNRDLKRHGLNSHNKLQQGNSSSRINEDDDTGEGGNSLAFHDFIGTGKPQRDDLSPLDIKHLLAQHDSAHRHHVEKQMERQKNRESLQNGRMSLNEYRHGQQESSGFKAHPALMGPQFSGIDNKENPLPTLNDTSTNDDERNENKLRNSPAPGAQNRFVPPRLTR